MDVTDARQSPELRRRFVAGLTDLGAREVLRQMADEYDARAREFDAKQRS